MTHVLLIILSLVICSFEFFSPKYVNVPNVKYYVNISMFWVSFQTEKILNENASFTLTAYQLFIGYF